ncbi:hypothetical protein [Lacticaseibacillus absianus]|uniref:hypothetical protein n=1 Tax=Lacticaseibacillus absianus TaxID=2729623 RepID=UPI0015CDF734|nr:hypothetical protein [Lacticaseibacillus absianus]
MKLARWLTGAVAIVAATILVACQDRSAHVSALKDFTTSTSDLTHADFYQAPDSNLATALLNRAEHAKTQLDRVQQTLSADQQAEYAAASDKLDAAKLLLAADTEIKHVLGDDAVIQDATYSDQALRTTLAKLKRSQPKYAQTLAPRVKLIDGQVAALQALHAAKAEPTNAAKRAKAEAAIRAVQTPGFQALYLPQVAALAPQRPQTGTTGDAAGTSETSSASTSTATSEAPDTATSAASSDQAPAADQPMTAPVKPAPAADDTTSAPDSDAAADKPDTTEPAATSSSTTKDPASANDPVSEDPVVNGPYDTMDAAIAAMKAAQGDSGRPATAYSFTAPDGSLHYTWKWLDTDN